MKKFFLIFLITIAGFSQSKFVTLNNLHYLSLKGSFKVILIPATYNKVVVIDDVSNQVKINYKNDKLDISVPFKHWYNTQVVIEIYVNQDLREINVAHKTQLTNNGYLLNPTLLINATDNAIVELQAKLSTIVVNGNLGCIFRFFGNAENATITLKNKSFFDAFNFSILKANVKMRFSNAAVYVKDLLEVNAKYNSELVYFSQPQQLITETVKSKVVLKTN